MKFFRTIKQSIFFIRLIHWEFWPFWVIYLPVFPIWLWFAWKARSLFFFNAANPGILNGGFLMESKFLIDQILPGHSKPVTLFFTPNTPAEALVQSIQQHKLGFPLIVKPDTGMQGKAVFKVDDLNTFMKVCAGFTVNFIIQPYVNYPNELGIFFVKFPNESQGRITGIVEKKFLSVIGDGEHTIEELLKMDSRSILHLKKLKKLLGKQMQQVFHSKILVPFGNHARGAMFMNRNDLINDQLNAFMNKLCSNIPGFFFGRFDIKLNTIDELLQNKYWKIIELNGSGSEPTHMYDPRHSIFYAWKEIVKHWNIMCKIAIQNNKKGISFLNWADVKMMFKNNRLQVAALNKMPPFV